MERSTCTGEGAIEEAAAEAARSREAVAALEAELGDARGR